MKKEDVLKVLEQSNKLLGNHTDNQLIHYAKLAIRERSEEERIKLSESSSSRKMSDSAIEKIRKANVGRIITDEHKTKISNTLMGQKLSNKTRKKMSESRIGMKHSKQTINKLQKEAQKRCVAVSKFSLDDMWIEDFIGLIQAANSIGQKNGRAIQLVCNYYRDNLSKGSKQCGGFIWKYKK